MATPHAYVFDRERKLQYAGRIDASEKPGTGHAEDLKAAIDLHELKKKIIDNPLMGRYY